jgi:RNA polymerase sigma-70 factor, ECF subfamily
VSAEEDAADVVRVLAGDVSAFEAVVRRWQGPLVNLAYRYCRDRARHQPLSIGGQAAAAVDLAV